MKEHKAVIDIETGGFSITKNGVCEIAMLIIDYSLKVVKELNLLIKPYMRECGSELVSYKEDAMAINKISMEELMSGEDVIDVMFKISNSIINYNITSFIGHNLKAFDIPRVDYLLRRFQDISISEFQCEDTLVLAKEKFSFDSNKLEFLCEKLGIINPNPHRAIGDCYATLELYKQSTK